MSWECQGKFYIICFNPNAKEQHKKNKTCQNCIVYFLNLIFSLFLIHFQQFKVLWVCQIKIYMNYLSSKGKQITPKKPWRTWMCWIFKCELNQWLNIKPKFTFDNLYFPHFVSFLNNLNNYGCTKSRSINLSIVRSWAYLIIIVNNFLISYYLCYFSNL